MSELERAIRAEFGDIEILKRNMKVIGRELVCSVSFEHNGVPYVIVKISERKRRK